MQRCPDSPQSSRRGFVQVASFGDIQVDFAKMELFRAGREVRLTATEYRLLAYLLKNRQRVVSRKELLDEVWRRNNNSLTRTVDSHVAKLRQKIETDPTRPVHLRTVHCVGYRFIP